MRDFEKLPDQAPALGLTECGEAMSLSIAFVGSVNFRRADSHALADHLEAAADMVRRHSGIPHPNTPCEAEIWSYDVFRPTQVDPYYIQCSKTIHPPTEKHEDSNTGATWEDRSH